MLNWLSEKIDVTRLQVILLQALALTLPFSIEISVAGNSKLLFPSEPLMVFLLMVEMLDLLIRPGSLGDLFPRRSWMVLPFMGALLLGTAFSEIKVVSMKFTAVNLLYILIFFFTLSRLVTRAPKLFLQLLSLYSIGYSLIAVLALYRYSQYGWNNEVVKAIFQPFYKDHTIFGATGALLSAFWLSHPRNDGMILPLVWQRITGIFMAGAVLLSYSRAAMLSLLVFLLFRLLFALRIRLWQWYTVIGILLIFFLINSQSLLSSLDANRHDSGDKQADIVEHALSAGNVNTDVSNRERLNRWISGLAMFAERPVTGFGPGTYQFEYIPFQKPEYMTRLSVSDPYHIPENSGGTAHSEYILALSEMGIPGILAWLVLISGLTAMAFRNALRHPNRGYAVAGFAALSTYFFHAFFNNFLNTDKFAFLFWGLIAWMCANLITIQPDEKRILS